MHYPRATEIYLPRTCMNLVEVLEGANQSSTTHSNLIGVPHSLKEEEEVSLKPRVISQTELCESLVDQMSLSANSQFFQFFLEKM